MDEPPTERQTDNGVQVLRRAATVLDAVGAAPGYLRLADLGPRVGMAKTTVYRIVSTLERERLLQIDGDGRIWLGARLQEWAGNGRDQLIAQVRPVLLQLAHRTHETVDLSLLVGGTATFIDQIPSAHRLRAVSAVGASFPLHACANGKAMLATFDDADALALCPRPLRRCTSATITRSADLRAELSRVRDAGFAIDRSEHTEGISAIGVAVADGGGQRLALSVPVPTERFAAAEPIIVTALARARAELHDILGLQDVG